MTNIYVCLLLCSALPLSAAVLPFEVMGPGACMGDPESHAACYGYGIEGFPNPDDPDSIETHLAQLNQFWGPGVAAEPHVSGNDLIFPVFSFAKIGDLVGWFEVYHLGATSTMGNFTRMTFSYSGVFWDAEAAFHVGISVNGQQIIGSGAPIDNMSSTFFVDMVMDIAVPTKELTIEVDMAHPPYSDSTAWGDGGFLTFTMEPESEELAHAPEPGTWIAGVALLTLFGWRSLKRNPHQRDAR